MTAERMAGAALMVVFLADIFLTVLYARAGTGLLAPFWNRLVWASVKSVAGLFGRRRAVALSFAGPLIVIALIAFWAVGLTVGAALVIHPQLGTAIRQDSGDTPTDFVTALMVAGNSLSIVGSGGYSPHTTGTRLLFLLNSLIGTSVLSLVLSYLMQIYSALRERNALALTVELMTGCTGDAARMLARLGPGGNFDSATSELGNLVRQLAMTKEAHHFYPLLFYFRFEQPFYSMSRISFILLDLTTLIDTALDRQKHEAFVASVQVDSLREAARLLVATLDENFPTVDRPSSEISQVEDLRRSYAVALDILRSAGAETQPDDENYIHRRIRWEALICRVATTLGYGMEDIDCRRPAIRAPNGPIAEGRD